MSYSRAAATSTPGVTRGEPDAAYSRPNRMRLLSKVAFGGGLASAATAGWLVAAGVFATSATLVVADPVAPRAEAEGLTGFDSCTELLDWYVEHGLSDVGPYGWDNPRVAYADARLADKSVPTSGPVPLSATSSGEARTSSSTGTNTQEAAVDE